MINPWEEVDFSKSPYALAGDLEFINSFNSTCNQSDHFIHLDIIPEPHLGNPKTCKILLLNLNPSYSQMDKLYHTKNMSFREVSIKNLLHRTQNYPFYLLDPIAKESPRSKWWKRILAKPIKEIGEKEIARSSAVIEYFPYHSIKYRDIGRILESQEYSFELVRKSLERKVTVILMRGFKKWFNIMPDLISYQRLLFCRSVQNPTISPRNLSEYSTKIEREKYKEKPETNYQKLFST